MIFRVVNVLSMSTLRLGPLLARSAGLKSGSWAHFELVLALPVFANWGVFWKVFVVAFKSLRKGFEWLDLAFWAGYPSANLDL